RQTYRHHLESFFYVLIVGLVSYARKSALEHLQRRSLADYGVRLIFKETNIILHFQSKIINNFTPVFERVQEPAWSLCEILFEDKSVGYEIQDTGRT
ncbi:Bgt-50124, partial [Blumeria graminis f. sp. tritici]